MVRFRLNALEAELTEPTLLFGIPFDFVLFAATLLGIALFHRHTLLIALGGLVAITAYKLSITGFKDGVGLAGLLIHLSHEFSLLRSGVLCRAIRDEKRTLIGGLKFEKRSSGMPTKAVLNNRLCINLPVVG